MNNDDEKLFNTFIDKALTDDDRNEIKLIFKPLIPPKIVEKLEAAKSWRPLIKSRVKR